MSFAGRFSRSNAGTGTNNTKLGLVVDKEACLHSEVGVCLAFDQSVLLFDAVSISHQNLLDHAGKLKLQDCTSSCSFLNLLITLSIPSHPFLKTSILGPYENRTK